MQRTETYICWRLIKEHEDFHEVRLVFDRYIDGSLKESTGEKRSGGKVIGYIIKDSTSFVGVKMKKLLSHILTKKGFNNLSCWALHRYFKQSWETVCCCFSIRSVLQIFHSIQKSNYNIIKRKQTFQYYFKLKMSLIWIPLLIYLFHLTRTFFYSWFLLLPSTMCKHNFSNRQWQLSTWYRNS